MVFSDDVVVVLHKICCGCVCIDKGDILMPREIRVVCCIGLAEWSGGEDDVSVVVMLSLLLFLVLLVLLILLLIMVRP